MSVAGCLAAQDIAATIGGTVLDPTGATIEGTQVRELSLVTRNYEQRAYLMPGVTASTTDELYVGVSAPSPYFGQITGFRAARRIQFGAKLRSMGPAADALIAS